MTTPAFCERHGLSFDKDQRATCPECESGAARATSRGARVSQLDTQPAGTARATARPREGASEPHQSARTTAHGARTTAHAGRRPSQLETQRQLPTQRPRLAPVSPLPSTPLSVRLHGWAALGLISLAALLGYRQWPKGPAGSAASSEAAAGASLDAGSKPRSTAQLSPPPATFGEEEEIESAEPSRARPAIRYRARAGELPDICRVPWSAMHDRSPTTTSAAGPGPHGSTPLMVAAESGSLAELQSLLRSGANVEARDALNHTALMYAARRGRDAQVEALMRAGADARTRGLWDAEGGSMTALDAALVEGATQTARLIEREVVQGFFALDPSDLSAIDEAGDTPLHWVARYADARVAQRLVQRGAALEMPNCPARPGDERGLHREDLRLATPLLVAVWAGNLSVARELLEAQANARAVDERGRGVFHVMRHPESMSLVAELLRAGAGPSLPDGDGKTPAELLSASGLRADFTRALRALGRPIPSAPATVTELIGVITRLGTPRGAAQRADDPSAVLALLAGDAMLVNEADAQGRTALSEAAFQGLPRVAEALIARGASVDARDHAGATPLHRARDASTIALLVRFGANVDARDQGGATPLHLRATEPGSLGAVSALLEAGANARLEDRGRRTPLDLARSSGGTDMVERLSP